MPPKKKTDMDSIMESARLQAQTRVIVDRDALATALKRVNAAVAKRSTMAILTHVRLTACLRNVLQIVATDLDVRADVEIDAGVPQGGWDLCVPADKLIGAVETAPEIEIRIEVDAMAGRVILTSGRVVHELAYLPADEFPASAGTGEIDCILPPGVLPRLLGAVQHAICRDESKYNLCGVRLQPNLETHRLEAYATDGHRLSVASVSLPSLVEIDRIGDPLTLPARALKLIAGLAGSIEIERTDSSLICDLMETSISARLLDGDYPDVRRVIPTDHKELIIVRREALIEALLACGVAADDKLRTVTLEARTEELVVSALGDLGTCTAIVPLGGEEAHAELKISVNSRYLIAALEALPGDEIWIKYGSAGSPLLLLPADMTGYDERLEIIMPMR